MFGSAGEANAAGQSDRVQYEGDKGGSRSSAAVCLGAIVRPSDGRVSHASSGDDGHKVTPREAVFNSTHPIFAILGGKAGLET
jgi:hypothetical protein